jgi:hypothetical protein
VPRAQAFAAFVRTVHDSLCLDMLLNILMMACHALAAIDVVHMLQTRLSYLSQLSCSLSLCKLGYARLFALELARLYASM